MTAQRRAEVYWHAPLALVRALVLAYIGTAVIGWAWAQNSVVTAYFVPTTYWVSGLSVDIPDHDVAADPLVVFNRSVHRTFVGKYVREFRVAGGSSRSACTSDGTVLYEVNDANQWIGKFSLYSGGCTLPPGCWVADTIIEFPVWGGASKTAEVTSSPFAVTSGGAVSNPCATLRL